MTLGLIADIHGNLEALRAVLDFLEARGVDRILCLGDLVGFGANPNECVAAIRDRAIPAVAGNHDLISIGRLGRTRCAGKVSFALSRTRRELTRDTAQFLGALPARLALDSHLVMIHGGYDDPEEYLTSRARLRRTTEAIRRDYPEVRLCLFGHTHEPRVAEITGDEVLYHETARPPALRPESIYLVNPGAVDGARTSGEPRARCAVLARETGQLEFHQLEYDHDAAEAKARERGYRIGPWAARLYRAAAEGRRWRRRARTWLGVRPPSPTVSAPATRSVRVEWLTRVPDIEALEPEWRALESAVQHRMVFCSFDYVWPWYRAYSGPFGTPLLGVVRRGTEVVAIAPFAVRRTQLGRVPVRRLDLAGFDGDGGEILLADGRPELLEPVLRSLSDCRAFDVLCLEHLRRESPVWEVLEDVVAEQEWRLEPEEYWFASVDLSGGYDTYWRAKSANFRRQTKLHARRVESAGAVGIDGVRLGDDPVRVPTAVERMFAIVDGSWKSRVRGRPMREAHREFYRELCTRFAARGLLDLAILTIDGRDAAVGLAVAERGIAYSTLVGYSEALQDLAPGTYLMQRVLRGLADAGIREFVSHGMYEYKKRWASSCPTALRALLFAERPRAWLAHTVRFRLAPGINPPAWAVGGE
jgi:predicted phosphodiesterase/CelD/BcsL family acetyltransferase involved in cellulose biosynthesis